MTFYPNGYINHSPGSVSEKSMQQEDGVGGGNERLELLKARGKCFPTLLSLIVPFFLIKHKAASVEKKGERR